MKHSFTQIDLITYLYGEATPENADRTEAALAGDPVLYDDLEELTLAQAALPRIKFNAPKRLLRSLLDYSSRRRPVCC
ncbi:MAG: hypothetical protein AAF741_15095 [Bacteroidota bacterium]